MKCADVYSVKNIPEMTDIFLVCVCVCVCMYVWAIQFDVFT